MDAHRATKNACKRVRPLTMVLSRCHTRSQMPSERPATTMRFTDEDREILAELQQLTGLETAAAVIRVAIREALAARRRRARR